MNSLIDSIANTYDLLQSLKKEAQSLKKEKEWQPRTRALPSVAAHCGTTERRRTAEGVESLLQKGLEYQEKREKAKLVKEMELLKELKPGPTMLKTSRNLVARSHTGKDLVSRMELYRKRTEEKQKILKGTLDDREIQAVRDAPEINWRSRKLAGNRSTSDMMEWESKRASKIALEREKKLAEEVKECNFKPSLNQHSRHLVQGRNRDTRTLLKNTNASTNNKAKVARVKHQISTSSSKAKDQHVETSKEISVVAQRDKENSQRSNERSAARKNKVGVKKMDEDEHKDDEVILLRCGGLSLMQESALFLSMT